MVSFVCDLCGESIKQGKVVEHSKSKCRSAFIFTCIECGKVVKRTEIDLHTSCNSKPDQQQNKETVMPKEKKRKLKEDAKTKEELEQKEVKEDNFKQQKTQSDGKVDAKQEKPIPKGILKNKEEKTLAKNPFEKLSKFEKISKDKITETIENTNITDINICDSSWIKENLLTNGDQFLGWKTTIKQIMNLIDGKSALKKKFKKCLRKTFELSSSFKKQVRKDLNSVIETELKACKSIRVFADLVENTGINDDE